MVHITVCDDELSVIDACKRYAGQFSSAGSPILEWRYLSDISQMNPKDLAREDILLLDIQMGPLNGIDLAREIRSYNDQNIIIFSTNYLEYALQGYEVAAFRYLKKPLSFEAFSSVMTEALALYRRSAQAAIVLRCGYQTERLQVADIMYCETQMGHIKLTLQDQSVFLANIAMGSLEEKLRDYNFFRCHKGCLVNLGYVKQPLKTDALMRDGALIPISKHRRREFMVALMKYWGGHLR